MTFRSAISSAADLGPIKSGLSERVRFVCEEFVRSVEGGKGRPIGGGEPGYSAQRREKSLAAVASKRPAPDPSQFVDRDPCPRCGTRGDIGCAHSRVRIGTRF